MADNLKKVIIPANGPGTHKEMGNRVKGIFAKYRRTVLGDVVQVGRLNDVEKEILGVIREYDIADAMRSFEGKEK